MAHLGNLFALLLVAVLAGPAAAMDFAVWQHIGGKKAQEDRFVADTENNLFAIFDGHGGDDCSDYLTSNLHDRILNEVNFDAPDLQDVIKKLYLNVDSQYLRHCSQKKPFMLPQILKNFLSS